MTSENVRCEKAFYRAIVINYTFVFFSVMMPKSVPWKKKRSLQTEKTMFNRIKTSQAYI